MKISCFKKICKQTNIRNSIFAAAVAAGVTSTFGTPYGGIIFSIEVTSSFYIISNLFKSFFCASFTLLIFFIIDQFYSDPWYSLIPAISIEIDKPRIQTILVFVGLGIVCGLTGVLFLTVCQKYL